MGMFRKKPVVIEAIQFTHDGTNAGEVINFTGGIIAELREPHIAIKTTEGTMLANPGDWIIRGVKGEFYPCKPDIFEATYESAEPKPRPTIEELDKILNSEDERDMVINPDGSITIRE